MRPDAQANAAISILDSFLVGKNLNSVLSRWAKNNRYAGSSDRESIRNIVFDILRVKKTFTRILEKEKQPLNGRALPFKGCFSFSRIRVNVFFTLNISKTIFRMDSRSLDPAYRLFFAHLERTEFRFLPTKKLSKIDIAALAWASGLISA